MYRKRSLSQQALGPEGSKAETRLTIEELKAFFT
jgi:hypothetical protein